MIWSLKNKATEIGYEILTRLNIVLGELVDVKLKLEPCYTGKEIFIMCAITGTPTYDFSYKDRVVEYGVMFPKEYCRSNILSHITFATDIYIKTSNAPYYSSPLYIWRGHRTVVLSPWRLPVLIAAAMHDDVKLNLDYMASLIIQGYPIEGDEIHSNVMRLPINSETTITPSLAISVREHMYYDNVLDSDVDRLIALLLEAGEAFITWASNKGVEKIRIGLSGGLDSRTTSAILAEVAEKLKIIEIETYTNKSPTTDPREVEIAKEVAKVLGLRHRIIYVNSSKDNPKKILQNMLGVIQPSKGIIADGTGGDKTLAPLGRLKWKDPGTLEDTARAIITRYDYTPCSKSLHKLLMPWRVKLSKKLLQVKEKTSIGLVRRYLVESRMANWLTAFTKPRISPFLYPQYFNYALKIKPEAKNYYVLYVKTLVKLNPKLLSIPYYNLGCKLTQNPLLQKVKLTLYFLFTSMKKIYRGQRGSLIPAKQAYEVLEKLYNVLEDRLSNIDIPSDKNSYLLNIVRKEAKELIDEKILDARAITVLRNILRFLAEFLFLHLSIK